MSYYIITRSDELYHHGIKGQKWGVRRYENADGTLTDAGKKRYAKAERIASREKISKEQMKKNALKRGAVGALVGSSVGQMVDRVGKKKAFYDSTSSGLKVVPTDDPDFSKKMKDVLYKDSIPMPLSSSRQSDGTWKTTRWGYGFTETTFASPGKAMSFAKKMTASLLTAPSSGALIGAGAGALGSVAVDSLHNARIDRAKNFIAKYQDAYNKTYS